MGKKISNIMRYYILVIAMLISFSSCLNYIARKAGVKSKIPIVTKLSVPNHDVLFLGMTHMRQQEFYDSAKKIIIDLKSKGFKVYAESAAKIVNNKIVFDSNYAKKARKIIGYDMTLPLEHDNSIIKALIEKFELVKQPSYADLGAQDREIVDVDYENLIDLYEKKYGEIILDSCDRKTDLGKAYYCETATKASRKRFRKEYLLEKRNNFVVQKIKNSNEEKILLIYGWQHLKGIKKLLKKKNQAP